MPNPPPRHAATLGTITGLIVILATAACSSNMGAPTPTTYVMTGTVRIAAATGLTVASAAVRILEDSVEGNPTVTDARGEFRLPAVLAGRHLIEVTKPGFVIWETEFTVVDRDLQLNVMLVQNVEATVALRPYQRILGLKRRTSSTERFGVSAPGTIEGVEVVEAMDTRYCVIRCSMSSGNVGAGPIALLR
jgi:hypothetical protein